MSRKKPSLSPFTSALSRYLDLKHSLGRGFQGEGRVLTHLDFFLRSQGVRDLTADAFACWREELLHLRSGVLRRRIQVVHSFCLYRRRTEPRCFVPSLALLPARHQPIEPYLFSRREIGGLLDAADRFSSSHYSSPLRSAVYRLAVVLLFTTGLRRGELLRLTVGDYDRRERTLLVRESKFHKSRLLPLSRDGAREMNRYLARLRDHVPGLPDQTYILWWRRSCNRPYSGKGITAGLQQLFRVVGISTLAGRLPRIHDFRHSFAVHALARWYRAGLDVQAKLPHLATYMGHVSILSTQYYLPFASMFVRYADQRFERSCGALVTLPPFDSESGP